MKIDTLTELKKLIQLCRKEGIQAIKVDGIELELTDKPKALTKRMAVTDQFGISADDKIQMPDHLTPEQLLFYSSDSVENVG